MPLITYTAEALKKIDKSLETQTLDDCISAFADHLERSTNQPKQQIIGDIEECIAYSGTLSKYSDKKKCKLVRQWLRRHLRNVSFANVSPAVGIFADIFEGHEHYSSRYIKKTGLYNPRHFLKPSLLDFYNHIHGTESMAGFMVRGDEAKFGALDVDIHKESGKAIDIKALDGLITAHKLPLIICQSKSMKGVHLYLFLEEFVQAWKIIEYLKICRNTLNLQDEFGLKEDEIEIFPKQKKLEKWAVGNGLNLPYFRGIERTAYRYGKFLDIAEFTTAASEPFDNEGVRITEQYLDNIIPKKEPESEPERMQGNEAVIAIGDYDVTGMPPCIRGLIKTGIGHGFRNAGLFHIAVYGKKWFGKEEKAAWAWFQSFNKEYVNPALNDIELRTAFKSGFGKNYKYKCKEIEDKFPEICDKKLCEKADFGIPKPKQKRRRIDPNEQIAQFLWGLQQQGLELAKADDITEYKQVIGGDKPYFEFKYKGIEIKGITVEQLINYKLFKAVIAAATRKSLPTIPASVLQLHDNFVNEIEEKCEVVKIEDGEGENIFSQIREGFKDWLKTKAEDLNVNNIIKSDANDAFLPDAKESPDDMNEGHPVIFAGIIGGKEGKYICFKRKNLNVYLEQSNMVDAKPKNLFTALKPFGINKGSIKINGKSNTVFYIPYKDEYFTD